MKVVRKHLAEGVVYVELEPGERCVVAMGEHRVWVRGRSVLPNSRTIYPVVGIMPENGCEAVVLPSRVNEAPTMLEIKPRVSA